MSFNIEVPDGGADLKPRILIAGVGGAGNNAVNNMIQAGLSGVEFWVLNTDAQVLERCQTQNRVQLGVSLTRGLGAGSDPSKGKGAAEESVSEISEMLQGCDMLFVTTGMGGGTGTGAAPVVCKVAKEMGILTVVAATTPFHFEGARRRRIAEAGIKELRQYVDTMVVIPNQNLFRVSNENTTFVDAFRKADDVLHHAVRSVTDLITVPGLINLDFADIKTVMHDMGKAMMGTGEAEGDNRALEAAEAAMANPLLDAQIEGAQAILVNITGGHDMKLYEVEEAVRAIESHKVDPEANIIFGSSFNDELEGRVRVSIVATGLMDQFADQGSGPAHHNSEVVDHTPYGSPKESFVTYGGGDRSADAGPAAGKLVKSAAVPSSAANVSNAANLAEDKGRQMWQRGAVNNTNSAHSPTQRATASDSNVVDSSSEMEGSNVQKFKDIFEIPAFIRRGKR